jgi:hypothetical protein
MSSPPQLPSQAPAVAAQIPPPKTTGTEGILGVSSASLDEQTEKRIDAIEMIGEEEAAGLRPPHSEVSAGMRYLHCSRTIHQLVTDRNRAVGIFLAVASLLWTASSAILNAKDADNETLLVPLGAIKRWCIPATAGTLTVLALFVGFLLIRTRIGLIYEVAKMNALLGLPVGRVKRIGVLSIFFIMHALISLAGGCSAAVLAYFLLVNPERRSPTLDGPMLMGSILIGFVFASLLMVLYVITVVKTTADKKLQEASK